MAAFSTKSATATIGSILGIKITAMGFDQAVADIDVTSTADSGNKRVVGGIISRTFSVDGFVDGTTHSWAQQTYSLVSCTMSDSVNTWTFNGLVTGFSQRATVGGAAEVSISGTVDNTVTDS